MRLGAELRKLVVLNASATAILIYVNIFVNLYIWQGSNGLKGLALFNLFLTLFWGLFYFLGAQLLSLFSFRILMITTALISSLSFFILSFFNLGNSTIDIILVALLFGVVNGFYYSGQNSALSLFGDKNNFSYYYSVNGAIGQVITIIMPIISSIFIALFGFIGSFIFMFILTLIMVIISIFVPSVTVRSEKNKRVNLLKSFSYKEVFNTKKLKYASISMILGGFFAQTVSIFLVIFTFLVSVNETKVAFMNVIYAVLTIIAMYVYKKGRNIHRITWLRIGLFISLSAFVLAFLLESSSYFWIANIIICIGVYYYGVNFHGQLYEPTEKFPLEKKINYLVWREIFINISRSVVMVIVLSIHSIKDASFMVLIIIAFIIAIILPLVNKKFIE